MANMMISTMPKSLSKMKRALEICTSRHGLPEAILYSGGSKTNFPPERKVMALKAAASSKLKRLAPSSGSPSRTGRMPCRHQKSAAKNAMMRILSSERPKPKDPGPA